MSPDPKDIALLVRDKYEGDASKVTEYDLERLGAGEPLAYVIGWVPFLGLRIDLSSRPLIPRPETEWWTEELIRHLRERFGEEPFTLLDMCAGSGAIGLAVLKAFPKVRVSFSELMSAHVETIRKNLQENNLPAERATICESDLFESFQNSESEPTHFDIIAANPPYIPEDRSLPESVSSYEPREALYSGTDGLELIAHLSAEAPSHLHPGGELWMECDTGNIAEAKRLLLAQGARTADIRTDLYGRARVVVAYY